MTAEKAYVWYDPEGDYLEVTFASTEGEWMDTEDERVMTKVDDRGNVIGFHILSVSTLKGKKVAPFEADLTPKRYHEGQKDQTVLAPHPMLMEVRPLR